MHSPVSIRHADLLNFLHLLLGAYVDRHRLGVLYREVVAVRFSSRNVFLPDLAFYRTERLGQIRDNHIEGAPDLVVEALSPRTAKRDTGPKFAAYEEHGVTEYWILDPATLAHRFYRRTDRVAGRTRILRTARMAGPGQPPGARRRTGADRTLAHAGTAPRTARRQRAWYRRARVLPSARTSPACTSLFNVALAAAGVPPVSCADSAVERLPRWRISSSNTCACAVAEPPASCTIRLART